MSREKQILSLVIGAFILIVHIGINEIKHHCLACDITVTSFSIDDICSVDDSNHSHCCHHYDLNCQQEESSSECCSHGDTHSNEDCEAFHTHHSCHDTDCSYEYFKLEVEYVVPSVNFDFSQLEVLLPVEYRCVSDMFCSCSKDYKRFEYLASKPPLPNVLGQTCVLLI